MLCEYNKQVTLRRASECTLATTGRIFDAVNLWISSECFNPRELLAAGSDIVTVKVWLMQAQRSKGVVLESEEYWKFGKMERWN